MYRRNRSLGFSLVEMLLVLVIIGVLSGIAIPSYLGQRRRARVVGDAISNIKALQMMLEAQKAESGLYGTPSTTYQWTADGSATTGPTLIPAFQPKDASQMNYTLVVGSTGITYRLTAFYVPISTSTIAFQTDQSGAELARLK